MNNNLNIDKNISDVIKNFNLCNNEFIKSESKDVRGALFPHESGNKKNYSEKNEINIKRDEKELIKKFNELKDINSDGNNKIIKKLNIEEKIKTNSFENSYRINKMNNLPESKEFAHDMEKVKKKIKIGSAIFVFYSVYALMEFYDSKSKINENVQDLINKKQSKANLFNYKLNLMIGIPIVMFLYYQVRQYKKIESSYKEVIRNKYYDEESGCENFNLAFKIKY
jgi:hypothetical protein